MNPESFHRRVGQAGPRRGLGRMGWMIGLGWAMAAWGGPSEIQGGVTFFRGTCDASAVISIGAEHEIVADDEDNVLRIYNRKTGGMPVWSLDLSPFLRVDPRDPEVDMEAAARVGNRIYWISSHGRNRKGGLRPSRHRFFATEIVPGPGFPIVKPVGAPVSRLLVDLLADARFASFGLRQGAALPPKAPGALNIEGLAALPDGRLLIGFRNPQPQGRALLIPLVNPESVVTGSPFRWGDPILLDLEHRGIRGLATQDDRVLIVAGAHDDASRSQYFEWRPGEASAHPLPDPDLGPLNPEGLEVLGNEDSMAWLMVSDDGTTRVQGRECKRLKDAMQKRFRGAVWIP